MPVIMQTQGEVGGGVVGHLQCPHCGSFSKSHAHMLSHLAASHPTHLDNTAVGRLGNILMYQSGVRLFHCSICFFNCRDFTKLYKHIITKHCMDRREEGGGGKGGDDGSEKGDEEEGKKDTMKIKRGSEVEEEAGDDGKEKGEEEEGKNDVLKRQRSSEGEEEEGAAPESVTIKQEDEGEKSELMEVSGYRCLICNWSHRQKSVAISHMVRKHNIPKAYANRGIKRDAATTSQMQAGGAEEDEGAGLSGEMLKEEMKATAKVVRFTSGRFVCLICGWKTKLKGFAISHVLRSHEVERPYSCKECGRSFFLPSRLHKHVGQAHRPGRFACPFCWFRSEFLGGFKRHCSRCNARELRWPFPTEEGGEVRGAGGEEEDNDEEEEDKKETRATRRQWRSGKEMEKPDDEDDDD